jgi:hypothetical protein
MKRTGFLVGALALLVAVGCSDSNPVASAEQDTTLESNQPLVDGGRLVLKFDEPLDRDAEQVQITLLEVGDSRCPQGVTCFWEGQVSITIGVVENGQDLGKFEINLHAGDEDKAVAVVGGHAIHLLDVAPFPKEGVEPARSDFVATLSIEKATAPKADETRWSLDGWLQGEYARDLDEDGKIDAEDFALFVNQRPADGQVEPGESRALLDFRTVDRGDSHTAALEKPALFVAGDASQVESFAGWLNEELAAQVRGVDFDRSWVIAVFRGLANSSGYGIETRTIHATEESVELIVDLKDPAADQGVAQVISYPYHIVVVPKETLQPVSGTVFLVHTEDDRLLVQVEYP